MTKLIPLLCVALLFAPANSWGAAGWNPVTTVRAFDDNLTCTPYDNEIYCILSGKIQNGRYHIAFLRSSDGGANWSIPQDLAVNFPTSDNYDPHLIRSATDGGLYLVFSHWYNGNSVVMSRSYDKGKTWSTPVNVAYSPLASQPENHWESSVYEFDRKMLVADQIGDDTGTSGAMRSNIYLVPVEITNGIAPPVRDASIPISKSYVRVFDATANPSDSLGKGRVLASFPKFVRLGDSLYTFFEHWGGANPVRISFKKSPSLKATYFARTPNQFQAADWQAPPRMLDFGPFPDCPAGYSQAHPSLGTEGNTLYLIYVVDCAQNPTRRAIYMSKFDIASGKDLGQAANWDTSRVSPGFTTDRMGTPVTFSGRSGMFFLWIQNGQVMMKKYSYY